MAQPNKEDSQMADGNDNPMIAAQGVLVASPTGGATVDAESRTAIDLIIGALEAHGLIADN